MREGGLFACAYTLRSSHRRCSTKKVFLKFFQISQETGLRSQACNFIKKVTPAQVFSCEFCEIFENSFFAEHLWVSASAHYTSSCYFHERKIDFLTQLELISANDEKYKILSTEHNNRFSSSLRYANQLASKCSF